MRYQPHEVAFWELRGPYSIVVNDPAHSELGALLVYPDLVIHLSSTAVYGSKSGTTG